MFFGGIGCGGSANAPNVAAEDSSTGSDVAGSSSDTADSTNSFPEALDSSVDTISDGSDAPTATRDWTVDPAIAVTAAASTLYAMSDVHGGYDRMIALLVAAKIIAGAPTKPELVSWSAGAATLVVVGDLFDKGAKGVEVVDALRALEVSASLGGGKVIVTLGNHEAEFLANPENKKATAVDGIDVELDKLGIAHATFGSNADPRGHWLRLRPFGARVGKWFFAHAGNTAGRTVDALQSTLRDAVVKSGYGALEIAGPTSILEEKGLDPALGPAYAKALESLHIVFGHEPSALGATGKIAVSADPGASLMRIDCGMSPDVNYSTGAILKVQHTDKEDVAYSLRDTGAATEIWRGAAL
ncbi:MAG: hypothetical protein NVSMB1_13850 [Polyangiales bacterium]